MSAVQHSHGSNEWGTPDCVLWRVRGLSPNNQIDFDPCSSAAFNERVQAVEYLSEGALEMPFWPWASLVIVNPPGNAPHEENMPAAFWRKLMDQRAARRFDHAIWVGFTLEHLRHCQPTSRAPYGNALLDFPLCVPRDRLEFVRPDGSVGTSPGHANVIAYIPGDKKKEGDFYKLFESLGHVR